jgi:hypothetical protein
VNLGPNRRPVGYFSRLLILVVKRAGPAAIIFLVLGFGFAANSESFPLTVGASSTARFVLTGSMSSPRAVFTATRLVDGKVLVAGGDLNLSPTAEVYDPSTGGFSDTGTMVEVRFNHTATTLLDGEVLITGGVNASNSTSATAELYDPSNGTFTLTAGKMTTPRAYHTASLLPDGSVLIVGGNIQRDFLASAELYDPSTETFAATGSMEVPRTLHTATVLPSGPLEGQVLVVGGQYNSSALASSEIYDPSSGTFHPAGAMNYARFWHTATLMPVGKLAGRVLIAGGCTFGPENIGNSAELFDPASQTFSLTGKMATGRCQHSASILPSGEVLVAGGDDNSAEIYVPSKHRFNPTGWMTYPRRLFQATLLLTGQILVEGGYGTGSWNAELYGVPVSPKVKVSTKSLALKRTKVGAMTSKTIVIRNAGKGVLTGSVSEIGSPFEVTSGQGVFSDLLENGRVKVTVTFAPTVAGRFTGELKVVSDDQSNPEIDVSVAGSGR